MRKDEEQALRESAHEACDRAPHHRAGRRRVPGRQQPVRVARGGQAEVRGDREGDHVASTTGSRCGRRPRRSPPGCPKDAVSYSQDGAPKTLNEFRSMGAPVKAADLPETRMAVYKYLIQGKEAMDAEEYRVLSKAASGGGFFVPTDLADAIVRALRFLPGGVGTLARTLTTSAGETINVPLNLTHGSAAWVAESGAYTPSDETITNATLSAYKAATKIIVSEELLTDCDFDLSSFITTEFGERIGASPRPPTSAVTVPASRPGSSTPPAAVTVTTLPAGQVATPTAAALGGDLDGSGAVPPEGMALLVSDSQWVRMMTLVDSTGRPLWNPSLGSGPRTRSRASPSTRIRTSPPSAPAPSR